MRLPFVSRLMSRLFLLIFLLLPAIAAPNPAAAAADPRVVSLVPAATEIIRSLGGQELLVGVTIHDVPATAAEDPGVVGGFLAPSLERIIGLAPDVIILADLHREVREHFQGGARLLEFKVDSLAQAFERIEQLADLIGRPEVAQDVIGENRADLIRVAEQVALIPPGERRRVMRLMSIHPLTAPGDNSFQNDFIRAAGGIPPHFSQDGHVIMLTPEEILAFDPQVIYVCGETAGEQVMNLEELKTVEAVRQGRVFTFPCDLTCRAGSHVGSFVLQLAARVYEEQFLAADQQF